MIKTIHIQNYKCLRDVKVKLGPFNVLIGQNDSGKTSVLNAVDLLGKSSNWKVAHMGGGAPHVLSAYFPASPQSIEAGRTLTWQKKRGMISFHVTGRREEDFEYRLKLDFASQRISERLVVAGQLILDDPTPDKPVKYKELGLATHPPQTLLSQLGYFEALNASGNNPVLDVVEDLGSTEEYHLNPALLRTIAPPEQNPVLTPTGDNLAAVLHGLLIGPDRDAIISLEKQINAAITTIKGVSTQMPVEGQGGYEIRFTLSGEAKPPVTIPCSQASDGAMLLTAFLALAYANTPGILLIEEPENGLHPSRLKMVIDLLRKMSSGEIGNKARQIIITTHSPLLLNFVKPEEVRIFQRTTDGATKVTPMIELPNIENLQKEFAPGEIWYLFGEEDLVKGATA
ncbi:MAG: ATP-binding protein [Gemmataceae bacterium]|nr:ATP-binding protein [Gemmataceae bacterium]